MSKILDQVARRYFCWGRDETKVHFKLSGEDFTIIKEEDGHVVQIVLHEFNAFITLMFDKFPHLNEKSLNFCKALEELEAEDDDIVAAMNFNHSGEFVIRLNIKHIPEGENKEAMEIKDVIRIAAKLEVAKDKLMPLLYEEEE